MARDDHKRHETKDPQDPNTKKRTGGDAAPSTKRDKGGNSPEEVQRNMSKGGQLQGRDGRRNGSSH